MSAKARTGGRDLSFEAVRAGGCTWLRKRATLAAAQARAAIVIDEQISQEITP